MVAANITISQAGHGTGSPGRYFVGVSSAIVTLTNENNAGVTNWKYELLDCPSISALVFPSVLSDGSSPTATFTPDVAGGSYRARVTVTGPSGSAVSTGNMIVPTTNFGWYLPPYQATATECVAPGSPPPPTGQGWMKFINNALIDIDSHLSTSFIAGGDLTGTNTSQTVSKIQSIPTPTATPSNGQVLAYDATSAAIIWTDVASGFTAGGDLTGTSTSQTVSKIQSIPTPTATPSNGQVLAYDATSAAIIWKTPAIPDINVTHFMVAGREITTWASPPKVIGSYSYSEAGTTMQFDAEIGVNATGVIAHIQVYDITHTAYLGSPLHATTTIPTKVSAILTRISPGTEIYETHLWYEYASGGPLETIDYAFCDFASLTKGV